jgi:oligopeptide transport system ATP-binding protein
LHPYTAALIAAVPVADPDTRRREPAVSARAPEGDLVPAMGCVFIQRCPARMEICEKVVPEMMQVATEHFAACHLHTIAR